MRNSSLIEIKSSVLINSNIESNSVFQQTPKFEHRVDEVFQNLPNQLIQKELSQKQILFGFLSKIMNESQDLEGDIASMVNENFWDLI